MFAQSIIHHCCFCVPPADQYSIVSATTGPVAMTDNNDNAPDDAVMASVLCGDGSMSFVAEAPLTVIAPAGYNNTATIAFALATTMGQASNTSVPAAQTHITATLAASEIVNAQSLLDTITAASEIKNTPFTSCLRSKESAQLITEL